MNAGFIGTFFFRCFIHVFLFPSIQLVEENKAVVTLVLNQKNVSVFNSSKFTVCFTNRMFTSKHFACN